MRSYLVLRVVSKLLMPFILLFALYVQFHGDFGPGGGFQAGVIFASAFILYALIFGVKEKSEKQESFGAVASSFENGRNFVVEVKK